MMGYNMYMYDISGDVPEDNDDDIDDGSLSGVRAITGDSTSEQ